MHIFVIVL